MSEVRWKPGWQAVIQCVCGHVAALHGKAWMKCPCGRSWRRGDAVYTATVEMCEADGTPGEAAPAGQGAEARE